MLRLATRWLAGAGLALCGCGLGPSPEPSAPPPPLFLLISIDTLRADHLGFYGYARTTSPYLDALARESVVFDAAQTTSPWTLPAHASILSGRYPSRHGLVRHGGQLREDIPTLASALARAGWATASIVNSRYLSARNGIQRGFEHQFVLPDKAHQQGRTREIVDHAIALIDEEDTRPLFLFVHTFDAHADYRSLKRHRALFEGPYDGNAAGFTGQLLAHREGEFPLEQSDLEHLRDLYDAGVHQLDTELGPLFESLRASGRMESSLIIVTADHGEEFLEHGDVLHGRNHFEPVVRVPLLIYANALAHGRRVAEPVSLVDILPTALSQLGVPAPEGLDGRDLTPLLLGADSDFPKRLLFIEGDHNREPEGSLASARLQNFKLLLDRASGEAQLHDIATDPGEAHDVTSLHPEVAKWMRSELEGFLEKASPAPPASPLPELERRHLESLGYLVAPSASGSRAEKDEVLPDQDQQAP